jgi:hypothetical protein
MALQLADERPAHRRGRGTTRINLSKLGWAHYWLLVSFLAAGLAFFVLILLAHPARG